MKRMSGRDEKETTNPAYQSLAETGKGDGEPSSDPLDSGADRRDRRHAIDWPALLKSLPGRAAQAAWSPRLAYGRHFSSPAAASVRDAAVAVLIYPRERPRSRATLQLSQEIRRVVEPIEP